MKPRKSLKIVRHNFPFSKLQSKFLSLLQILLELIILQKIPHRKDRLKPPLEASPVV